MASFTDLPPELIVNIMIRSAIDCDNFDTAYALAMTSKKHYTCFIDQERQIFTALVKYFVQPEKRQFGTPGRYNITVHLGDVRIVSLCHYPGNTEPTEVELVFKTTERDVDLPIPGCFGLVISSLRGQRIPLIHQPFGLVAPPKLGSCLVLYTRTFSVECRIGEGPWDAPHLEEGSDIDD